MAELVRDEVVEPTNLSLTVVQPESMQFQGVAFNHPWADDA